MKNVRKLLVHNRLAKRLTAIKALVDMVGRNKSKLAKLVAEETWEDQRRDRGRTRARTLLSH